MDMHKNIQPSELKVADSGEVEAVIATFDTIDKDHDVTRKGFFGTQPATIVWAHDWSTPVGKGTIFETDVDARFTGAFFLETTAGKEAHATVKAMGDSQEWSYGFDILNGGSERGQFDGQDVRFLQAGKDGPGAKVYEVSPVLVGAGEGTRTVAVKGITKFTEQLDLTVEAVKAATLRAKEIAALRHENNKQIGDESRLLLADLSGRLVDAKNALDALLADPASSDESSVAAEFARWQELVYRYTTRD